MWAVKDSLTVSSSASKAVGEEPTGQPSMAYLAGRVSWRQPWLQGEGEDSCIGTGE